MLQAILRRGATEQAEYKGHNASIMCNMPYVTCYMLCAYAAEQVEYKGHMLLSIHQSQTPHTVGVGAYSTSMNVEECQCRS